MQNMQAGATLINSLVETKPVSILSSCTDFHQILLHTLIGRMLNFNLKDTRCFYANHFTSESRARASIMYRCIEVHQYSKQSNSYGIHAEIFSKILSVPFLNTKICTKLAL